MNKSELEHKLRENHVAFLNEIKKLSEKDFEFAPAGKWSAGQQLNHIIKSVSPVNLAFSLPDFLLKLILGKANRESRTYEALVEKYKLKLSQGGKAPSRFVPSKVRYSDRKLLEEKLIQLIDSLCKRLGSKTENQLDLLILPHPLLGKLTFREMVYFTIYHVEHHHKSFLKNLNEHALSQ